MLDEMVASSCATVRRSPGPAGGAGNKDYGHGLISSDESWWLLGVMIAARHHGANYAGALRQHRAHDTRKPHHIPLRSFPSLALVAASLRPLLRLVLSYSGVLICRLAAPLGRPALPSPYAWVLPAPPANLTLFSNLVGPPPLPSLGVTIRKRILGLRFQRLQPRSGHLNPPTLIPRLQANRCHRVFLSQPVIYPRIVIPSSKTPSLRRYSYNPPASAPPYSCTQAPPLPPRRRSVAVPSLALKTVTQSVGMDSRYYRPSSPRGRFGNPARSSTGTFDPYHESTQYGRPSSPRTSGERIAGSHYPSHTYAPTSSSGSRTSNLKYDSYSGRPRRNTLNEEDRTAAVRPSVNLAPVTALPSRTHSVHTHHERPASPLARSWDNRGDTYITQGGPRREHKRIYSVDDNSHSAKLIAEKDVIEPRRRDAGDSRGYSVTSGGRTYNQHKPSVSRVAEVEDEGFSYTDPASMYRDTEPAWRRPRSGSMERGSRPISMVMDRAPRTSARELGPPPSTRGFDKINNGVSRGSHHRSSSIERSRDVPKYDPYPDPLPVRSSSTVHHAPAIHQEPRDPRRDSYRTDYDRRDRDSENRRYAPADQFEDREVTSRGFGIASPITSSAPQDTSLDRQAIRNAPEAPRARPAEYADPYYSADRAEARMPEPRPPRDRDVAPTYEERPRERDRERRDSIQVSQGPVPIATGAAAGVAATLGAAELMKSRDGGRDRDRDREREREREREAEKERERRREMDERDRRDRVPDDRRDDRRDRKSDDRREDRRDRAPEERREERRDRKPEDRREERRDRGQEERLPPPSQAPPAAYPTAQETDRKPREIHYEDEDRERQAPPPPLPAAAYPSAPDDRKPRERRYEDDDRERRPRKHPSPEGSSDERPRHYVDRDAARESERRKDPVSKDDAVDPDEEYRRRVQQQAALDPDEEYRRRIQQEAERSGRGREANDSDREKERRRRKENREKSREPSVDPRSRGSPVNDPARSSGMLNTSFVQEPDSIIGDQSSKSVQIVSPPKDPLPQPRGILRKPTEKFPEHPEPIREGVAPHKSQLKGKDIPQNARWTKIDRRLVNPQALEEAKERFEERLDCVIVLKVLTKQEIQKLADRTKEIRESREEEPEDEPRDRRDRDRRSHRSHRDDEDRDRRRDYDDRDDDRDRDQDRDYDRDYDDRDYDDVGRDRERDRERDRPRAIEY